MEDLHWLAAHGRHEISAGEGLLHGETEGRLPVNSRRNAPLMSPVCRKTRNHSCAGRNPLEKENRTYPHSQRQSGTGGAVAKITGKGISSKRPAPGLRSEEDMLHALEQGKIQKGDIIVIRCKPLGKAVRHAEMLTLPSAVMGAGLGKEVAIDRRSVQRWFRTVSSSVISCRKLQEGGPIALIQDGDMVTNRRRS